MWLNAEAMESGYMLSAMPMSVTARFTVRSSGALSPARWRVALTKMAALPKMDRIAVMKGVEGANGLAMNQPKANAS